MKPAVALPLLCRLRGHGWRVSQVPGGTWVRKTCPRCQDRPAEWRV